ncbi:MAG: Fe(2+) transporter permease subunit FeoB [Endozoicomonas sp. (ex Botrylloides leachii)]|nr:Fe(2+) transporter permease subunit FeoB [Endozoicomonas sp. (ex Botrylloides leachii)]
MKDYCIALVGNPNSGKTTLFNALTGASLRVGNWPGVTVEKRSGQYHSNHQTIEVVDLPGTYCLDAMSDDLSIDEQIAQEYILESKPDLIVNIIDASNLERNLYLTTQLLDMQPPMVIVLNMMDVATEKGVIIDVKALSNKLKCPVLSTVANKERNAKTFKQELDKYLLDKNQCLDFTPTRSISFDQKIEDSLAKLYSSLKKITDSDASLRWRSLQLLRGDTSYQPFFPAPLQAEGEIQRTSLEEKLQYDIDILIANGRYNAIAEIATSCVKKKGESSRQFTKWIDRIVVNKVLGLPIFFGVMYLMFMFSMNFGGAFIDFFGGVTGAIFVNGAGAIFNALGAPPWLVSVLADGVGAGIQTTATFIPQIGCLFLFLSLLEDSGYMARAAFIMDRAMRVLGLPGKAFVPMIVGFGCNVPSMMATRTMDSEKDRLLTMVMAPFMSCSARLPVYTLFVAAFFPKNGQNIVFILYLIGIIAAIFTGFMLKSTLLISRSSPFIMELPDYHLPSMKHMLLRTWDRLRSFLMRAGKVIVVVVVILNTLNAIGTDGSFGHQDTSNSMLSKIGQTITPIFHPMGMTPENWPAAVGVFTGLLAKETVVGTLNAMYHSIAVTKNNSANKSEPPFHFWQAIQAAWATVPTNLAAMVDTFSNPIGIDIGDISNLHTVTKTQGVNMDIISVMHSVFPNTAAVIAYLLFILLYVPCVSVLGAVYREASLRWAVFISAWTCGLAYAVATIYYQLSIFSTQPLASLSWVSGVLAIMMIIFLIMRKRGMTSFEKQIAFT